MTPSTGAAGSARVDSRWIWIVLLLLTGSYFVFLLGDHRAPAGQETAAYFGWLQSTTGHPLLGILLDELILLVGVWLLARSLFTDPRTWFFVSVAAIGSSLWIDAVGSNFRSFHALPLLLHLMREVRASRSPAALLAALNLAGLQALGKPPAQALFAPLSALLLLLVFRRFLDPRPASTVDTRRIPAAIAVGVVSWIPIAVLHWTGSGDSVGAGTPPHNGAVWPHPGCLLDLLCGMAVLPDFTLYCGMLTLGFAVLALSSLGLPPSLRLLGEAGTILLLPVLVSALVGRPFPSLSAPLGRLLLIFLAGVGVDRWLQRRPFPRLAFPLVGVGLLLLAGGLFYLSIQVPTTPDLKGAAAGIFGGGSRDRVSPLLDDRNTVRELLDISGMWALFASGLFFLAGAGRRAAPLAIALALLLHPLDVFGWKMRITFLRTQGEGEVHQQRRPLTASHWPPAGEPKDNIALGRPESAWRRGAFFLLGVNALLWIAGLAMIAVRQATRPSFETPAAGTDHG